MKIFLDTGNLDEIRHATDLGVVDGVTTNPTLASKEGRPFRELLLEMCALLAFKERCRDRRRRFY